MKRLLHASLAFAVTVAALEILSTPTARADAGGPWYGGVGVGPWHYFDCCGTHFRVSGELGWHPSGHDEGFFIGIDLTTSFADRLWQFQTGLRLGGDIEVWHNSDMAILLVPAGMIGFGILDWDNRDTFREHAYFLLQPSFGAALVLADRLIHIFVRPISFDLMFFPEYAGRGFDFDAAYSAIGGIHFTFG